MHMNVHHSDLYIKSTQIFFLHPYDDDHHHEHNNDMQWQSLLAARIIQQKKKVAQIKSRVNHKIIYVYMNESV